MHCIIELQMNLGISPLIFQFLLSKEKKMKYENP